MYLITRAIALFNSVQIHVIQLIMFLDSECGTVLMNKFILALLEFKFCSI